MNWTVDVIGIYVAVSDIGAALDQSNPRMLKWLQLCISVQVSLIQVGVRLLVWYMLFSLCQFAQKAELCLKVAHESLPFKIVEWNTRLKLL